MRFLGLDLSLTETGVCTLSGSSYSAAVIKPGAKKFEPRLRHIRDEVSRRLDGDFDMVAIEGYAYGARNKLPDLGELGGTIRLLLHEKRVPFVVVPPNTLKLFATGKGNGGKDLMMLGIYKTWKVEFTNNNEADAYALARYAQLLCKPALQERAHKYQLACLSKCRMSTHATKLLKP